MPFRGPHPPGVWNRLVLQHPGLGAAPQLEGAATVAAPGGGAVAAPQNPLRGAAAAAGLAVPA